MHAFTLALAILATPVATPTEEPTSAASKSDPFDDEYDKCLSSAPAWLQTTGDLYRECGAAWRKRAELDLREAFKSASSIVASSQTQRALASEQRAFETAMAARCSEYTTGEYGTMGGNLDWFVCEARLIRARIAYLRAFAKGRGEETRYD